MNEETKKLREKLDQLQTVLASAPAQMSEEHYKNLCAMLSSMRSYMYSVEDAMWANQHKHAQGHLPPIKGAGKMKSVLKKLDMHDDYAVETPTLTVASTNKGLMFEATLEDPK